MHPCLVLKKLYDYKWMQCNANQKIRMNKYLLSAFLLGSSLCSPLVLSANTLPSQAEQPVVSEESILAKVKKMLPNVHGYLQTGYNYGNSQGDNTSSFKVNRLRLFVDKEINKTFDLRVQTELFSGSVDGTKYHKRVMTVMDAYVNINLGKRFKMRVGQYFVPLGFENYNISPATLELVNFSDICFRMECRNPISSPLLIDYGRDIGVMVHGDLFENTKKGFSYVNYVLSVANGSIPTLNDDNKSKDIVGRLTVQPVKDLLLMGSYSWGESQGMGLGEQLSKYTPLHRMVAGAWYKSPTGFSIRAEYGQMWSQVGGQQVVDETGFYALASQRIGRFTPVLKYEQYRDRMQKTSAVNRSQAVAGLNYQIHPSVKLQVDYGLVYYPEAVRNAGVRDGLGDRFNAVLLVNF